MTSEAYRPKTMSNLSAIILAGGRGTRMRSDLPKVLHPCGGLPLVCHVVRLARTLQCYPIVIVVPPQNSDIEKAIRTYGTLPGQIQALDDLRFIVQPEARGTGDAARYGMTELLDFDGRVLILSGDVPLLQATTLMPILETNKTAVATLLTAKLVEPEGYGRILRKGKNVMGIVEHKDASATERKVNEINAGVYCFASALLKTNLDKLKQNNVQGEFYLTDVIGLLCKQKKRVAGYCLQDNTEIQGINTRQDLAQAELLLRNRSIRMHQQQGVSFQDPEHVYIDVDVKIEQDVFIGAGVELRGRTQIGQHTRIAGPTFIKDSVLAAHVTVNSFCHIEQTRMSENAVVGPFARLRPGSVLGEASHVGNFVELKNTTLGKASKANHLAYLGDTTIGERANIGAGTITCNYDGYQKHKTSLGDGCFIGSNSTLIAPVNLENNTYVAAGSVVTKNVPEDALAFGRSRQDNRLGYAKHLRERLGKNKKE